MEHSASLRDIVRSADSFIITAGAGMGVDSGLPDFRGKEGFWKAYPPFRKLGLSFTDLANPRWFEEDPRLAWGFYGHRLDLYRTIAPHNGFTVLRDALKGRPHWVFTSNVDGQFQRAGLSKDRIVEIHGSIHHLQCATPCSPEIWSARDLNIDIDPVDFRWRGPLPTCPQCGAVVRPNILMFGDGQFLEERTETQFRGYSRWLQSAELRRCVVIEIGAGTAVPTIRFHSERVQQMGSTLIRINPRQAHGPPGTKSMETTGVDGIEWLFHR